MTWKLFASRVRPKTQKGVTFGTDCLPAFKERMLEADRCTHPEVQFVELRLRKDKATELIGVRVDQFNLGTRQN